MLRDVWLRWLTLAALAALSPRAESAEPPSANDESTPAEHGFPGAAAAILSFGSGTSAPIKINEAIYQATGFGNTYLIATAAGNVVVDTSLPVAAVRHKRLLQKVHPGPVRYIILTHAHPDHTGGVAIWKESGTEIVAQKNHLELRAYQRRLADRFAQRNAAQYGLDPAAVRTLASRNESTLEPTILVDEKHSIALGGVDFELYATPGETYDHLTVWLPQYRAAFVGDNFYASFPNIYTLRGSKPRWALDYIASIDKILALEPELLLLGHGEAVRGSEEIERQLTRYRDAIRYVHDATVEGMNAGKDVFTLMREIELPPALALPEVYGTVPWSVRGIYEGYIGWFDENPASMYPVAPESILPDLVRAAGGAEKVAALARGRLEEGEPVLALRLADAALQVEPADRDALKTRLDALLALRKNAKNMIEQGWLGHGIRATRQRLEKE